MAGYDAEKQIKTLPTVLNLATAGGMELAYSSDMVTDAMSALGISADNVSTFADKLAKTAQKSNTSVSQLGEAILTIGGTAKQLKGGVTELNTALGILADNGIKGEEGGTQLRNILNDLTEPTADATKALKAMNVEIYDSTTGGLRSLADIFSDINSYLKQFGDNDEAINSMLNPIFDVRNMKGVQALLANSGERFQELSFYINDSEGAAKKMADTMADNLSGSLTILKSGLEACGLTIYENIEEPFKMAVNTAIEEVTKLNQSMESGDLQVSIQKIAEGFSELLETVVDLVVDDGIPVVIDGLEWIADNGATIKSVLIGIGAGFLTFKVGSIIISTATAFKSFTTAVKAGATAMELFNTVSNKNPYVLITTAVLTTVPAIISYINATNEAKDVTKSYREELEKTKKSADEMRLSSETEISLIERKVGRYEYLRKALGENASQSKEFTVLAEELQEMLGNSIEVIDSVTGAYNDLSQSAQIAMKNMHAEAEFNARKSVYEAEIAQLVELKEKQAQARTEFSLMMEDLRLKNPNLTDDDIKIYNLDGQFKDEVGLSAITEQILLIEAEISEFESYAESYYANIEDVMQQTNETAVESAEIVVKPAEALNSALKTVNESIQSYHDSVNSLKSANDMLSSAFQEQTENGKLSVDTIMSLIDNGYSLALQWDNETGSCTLLKDKVTEVTSAKYAQIKADLRLQYIDLKQKYDEEAKALENLEGKINSATDAQLYMTRIRALKSSETELSNMESYMNMLDNMLKDTETIDKVVEVETVAEDVTDPRIEALKKEKEIVEAIQKARQQELDIKKAMIELENAQNQKNQRVYYEEKGWVWEADKKAINEKTENLNKLLADRQITSLDNQINGIDISSYANDFQSIVNSFSSLSSHFDDVSKNIGDNVSNTSNNNSVTINVENINTNNPVDFLGELNKIMNDANMKMMLEE